ncbi:hypothetical protein [Chryseobacterium gallinarum]|uniref:Apea-like HEPN domain-containing protein n=1 Tax=Chryseobacterium gallinarum TaxID=1324352 RepID=A0ABX6KP90_CHRGL|nr:hypothetical protein [Chryseobacterium gallinarum]QIY90018.1 hypothetical protein FOB44_04800 [Chryseobacterium gallinarum]
MPLRLNRSEIESEIILDNLHFFKEESLSYFRVSNSENLGINVEYIPIKDSKWDENRFELFIFENPYLTAENDVFEVYESTIKERLGWIFPLTILESNENDFVDHKNLNDYKFIAYKKLLSYNLNISEELFGQEFVKLSDMYGDKVICLLCKETIKKIVDFKIENYILSFYKYGYLLTDGKIEIKAFYEYQEFSNEVRKKSKIKIKKSKFPIDSNAFTKSLFIEHILQSESYLVRFILLYQIIEHFMEELSEQQYNEHIEDYKKKQLGKNDFRELINRSSTERDLVRSIFDGANLSDDLKNDFVSEVDFLYTEIGRISKRNLFSDKIYNIRNLVTHSLRDLTYKAESLKKITELFERIIIELLINNTLNLEKKDSN